MSDQHTTQDGPWSDKEVHQCLARVYSILIEAGRRRQVPGARVIGAEAGDDLGGIDVQIEIVITLDEDVHFVTDF
jgi:hypothetical protein